jgi:Tol biopolymer transport system component
MERPLRLTSRPREQVTSGSSATTERAFAFSSIAGAPARSPGGSKLPFGSSRSGDEEIDIAGS